MLPFSRRETTAVTVFACIFANRNARHLTTNVPQISALQLNYALLLRVYHQICHQDVPNQAVIRQQIINDAGQAICDLNAIVQAISPTSQNSVFLAQVQSKVANASVTMANHLLMDVPC
jgi:hypothetical protein